MTHLRSVAWRSLVPALAAVLLPLPGAAQPYPDCNTKPYVFILFDTSGSTNWSPPCTQGQLDAGLCSLLCPTGDCFVPRQGDDPASKLYQMKEALFTAIANTHEINFGFATFNQDELRVRAKHWIYVATNPGVAIPGGVSLPAVGAQEVFGLNWTCDTGSGDHEIGCSANTPADLPDAWELARVRRLPKGGAAFNQITTFYVRNAGAVYRVRYTPFSGTLGNATLQTTVNVVRCLNSSCSTNTLIGQTAVTWQRTDDGFLAWESPTLRRTNPELAYFPQSVANDASAANTCAGWDPNNDTPADRFNGYNLRWPTAADPRSPYLDRGDVLPFDWLRDQRSDILLRLAPNLLLDPLATPDFRVAPSFEDHPRPGETFLRLRVENARPLLAVGSTPHSAALQSFFIWYTTCIHGVCSSEVGWAGIAGIEDPEWLCRRKYLLVLTDGDETCTGGGDACTTASNLSGQSVPVVVVAFGAQTTPGSVLECMASQGGSLFPAYPQTKQELIDTLNDLFTFMAHPE